jgi:hypothetical protein
VTCPLGKIVIGGGYEVSTGMFDVVVSASRPLNPTTWRVVLRSDPSPVPMPISLLVWANCVTP